MLDNERACTPACFVLLFFILNVYLLITAGRNEKNILKTLFSSRLVTPVNKITKYESYQKSYVFILIKHNGETLLCKEI